MSSLRYISLGLAACASAAVAQDLAGHERDIVVTGRPYAATEAALKACIARACPVSEDIAASLAHAENLFVAGRYQDARQVLLAARRRDAKYSAQYPVEVAGLVRANARMASLVGEPDLARIGMIDALDALRAGLPENDPRVLLQKLEVGDALAKTGRVVGAVQAYSQVAREAKKLKLPMVEGHALFRTAILYSALADVTPAYASAAREACVKLEKSTDPALAPFKQGTSLIRAMLSAQSGDKSKIEKAIAAFQEQTSREPVLVYAPAIRLESRNRTGTPALSNLQMRGDDHAQWLDVGFKIASDGTVRDATVIRRSDNAQDQYIEPILTALMQRRYTPPGVKIQGDGLFRVERYSIVSDVQSVTGSHISTRSSNRRIEMLDLTLPAHQPGTAAVG